MIRPIKQKQPLRVPRLRLRKQQQMQKLQLRQNQQKLQQHQRRRKYRQLQHQLLPSRKDLQDKLKLFCVHSVVAVQKFNKYFDLIHVF